MGKVQKHNDNDIVVLNEIQNNDIDNVGEQETYEWKFVPIVYMATHGIERKK